MAADLDPPMTGARARRPKRAVITDDSYDDAGYLEREEPPEPSSEAPPARRAAPPSRAPRRAAAPAKAKRVEGYRDAVVWRLAVLATLLWIGGVLAFAAGFFQLPLQPLSGLLAAAGGLPPHLLLMTGAVAIAPLGLIWLTGLSARRAAALRAETEKLVARIESGGGGGAAGPDAGKLREDAEAAARAMSAVFEAAEERAQLARDRLQSEREAIQRLLGEIEGGSARIAGALSDAREKAGAGAPRAAPSAPRTMGLEPSSMLAGATRSEPEPIADDPEFEEEDEEFAPALGPERRADDQPAPENGRARQLEQIDALRRRVESGRAAGGAVGGAAAATAAAPAAAASALDWGKLVAAANFPESEDDQKTLDALYAVLTDPEAAALLQAAEDALSGLADAGLFMEDMQPHHAPTELWRAYVVDGDRRDVMDLGGVRDPHAIEDATEALRGKPEFAEIAERFLDRYETMVERLFNEAPNPTMAVELADTRSGRAYMLLARASGRFG